MANFCEAPRPDVIAAALAAALAVAPNSGRAFDLNGMSVEQKKLYCVVYVDFDGQVQVAQDRMSKAEHRELQLALADKLFGPAGNRAQGFVSRYETAFEAIVAEDPPIDVLAQTAQACRAFLRL